MNKCKYILYALFLIGCLSGCEEKEDPRKLRPIVERQNINPVSQFAYDGLSIYYKWADKLDEKEPTISDNDPKKYFKSLLSEPDTKHGWSWITDDVEGLLKEFAGKSLSFGYKLKFTREKNKIFALVKYVYPNSPAYEKGLRRLDLIGEINGRPITTEKKENGKTYISDESWNTLFGNNQVRFSVYKFKNGVPIKNKEITITPREIDTNPVLLDSIYTIGNKKIGYLFYTSFIDNYNSALYQVFEKFKQERVTDLVLDLRYNHGGAVSSAVYLASMIAPRMKVESKEVLLQMDYNKSVNAMFDKNNWKRTDKLGTYNTKNLTNPLNANLNLQKVYIIATGDSYSASELTTFCLKSHMEVVHIGNKTGGKYTASWTVVPYNEKYGATVYDENKVPSHLKTTLKNWAMQPIVAIYTNKEGQDFSATDGLIPNYELYEGNRKVANYTQLGDTKDVFLGQALYLITNDEQYKPKLIATKSSIYNEKIHFKGTNVDEIIKNSVLLDNPLTTEQMQEFIKFQGK